MAHSKQWKSKIFKEKKSGGGGISVERNKVIHKPEVDGIRYK